MKKRIKQLLSLSLSTEELAAVSSSYDIVGNIAIIKSPKIDKKANALAAAIMRVNTNVKTVLVQTSKIDGDFRLRNLSYVAGENRTSTVCRESGCVFSVDVSGCYFSPRLSYERSRIASLVKRGETVINMFAGVGCFSIIIAKQVPDSKVFSIDVNPAAFQCMCENINLNRMYGKVVPLLGDSKTIVESQLQGMGDRVLMPLPEKALEYLPVALSALKPLGGWIHYYDFEHARRTEDPVEKTKLKVARRLECLGVACEFSFSRVVRTVGPNWYQTVLDLHIAGCPTNLNNRNHYVSIREQK